MKDIIEKNKNENGGGLAMNVTGKFESNRHAIARIEKFTFGEVCKELAKKKNGGMKISAKDLLEIYTDLFGTPEWHHAGKLPKQYGGGMKKTYFLNEIPNVQTVMDWKKKYDEKQIIILREREISKKKIDEKNKFARKFGTTFSRQIEVPKYGVVQFSEMHGKYGWFVVEDFHNYSLTEYFSGIAFKSKKSMEKFLNM